MKVWYERKTGFFPLPLLRTLWPFAARKKKVLSIPWIEHVRLMVEIRMVRSIFDRGFIGNQAPAVCAVPLAVDCDYLV